MLVIRLHFIRKQTTRECLCNLCLDLDPITFILDLDLDNDDDDDGDEDKRLTFPTTVFPSEFCYDSCVVTVGHSSYDG